MPLVTMQRRVVVPSYPRGHGADMVLTWCWHDADMALTWCYAPSVCRHVLTFGNKHVRHCDVGVARAWVVPVALQIQCGKCNAVTKGTVTRKVVPVALQIQ